MQPQLESMLATHHTLETQLADALAQVHEAATRAAAAERAAVEHQSQVEAAHSQIKAMESRLEASANEASCREQQLHAELVALRQEAGEGVGRREVAVREATRVAEVRVGCWEGGGVCGVMYCWGMCVLDEGRGRGAWVERV